MKINSIQPQYNFKARLPYGYFNQVVKDSAQQGMSKRYINLLVNKMHKYFPNKGAFIYFDDMRFDDKTQKYMRSVTVEMKNPKDWDPRKSIFKMMKFPDKECDYKEINWLPKYVETVKKMTKLDFSK